MKDVVKVEKARKLNRPITGIIQKDKIWEQWYSSDIDTAVLPKMNQTEYLFDCNKGYEDQTIINYRGMKKLTIADFSEVVDNFIQAFLQNGIKKGDIICTIGLSTPEIVAIKYAAATIGAITSNLNFNDAKTKRNENLLYSQLKTINPKMIFTLDLLENQVAEILNDSEFSGIRKVRMPLLYSVRGDYLEKVKLALLKFNNKLTGKSISNSISLKNFLNVKKRSFKRKYVYEEKLPSNIAFTSGTTGINKAVLLSHDANNALAYQHYLANLGLSRGEKNLALVPPFLAFWDADIIHMAMCLGIENILELELSYENIPKLLLKYLPEYGIWSQYLWDSVLYLDHLSKELIRKHTKKAVIGGERCERNQAETFYEQTGIIQDAGFGATEVDSCFSVANPNCNEIGSAGLPLPFNNLKIVDSSFKDLTYNVPGRLLITGPCLMNGYYKNEELTKKVLYTDSDGTVWYDTKDYAYVSNNGSLFVLDRDVQPVEITSSSKEKVQLLDVVEKFKNNRNIKICKLMALNGIIVLHLVLDSFYIKNVDDAIESIKDTIREFLDEALWPDILNVMDSLPRTPLGKVDYKKLESITADLTKNANVNEKFTVNVANNSKGKSLQKCF